jgi:predicted RNA binding protein YcfA (HicA-like mRNA interferase family)
VSVLPRISGQKVLAALSKAGYKRDRQKGSHIVLCQMNPPHRRVVVPDQSEDAKGIFRAIIKQTGLTVEEFKKLL